MPDRRAPLNTSADLWTGPGAAVPNTLYATITARLVLDPNFLCSTICNRPRIAWLTSLACPNPPQAPPIAILGQLSIVPATADQIAVPSGTPVRFWVVDVERCQTRGGTPYCRAWLARLPLPP
jgi:hypothetical protein